MGTPKAAAESTPAKPAAPAKAKSPGLKPRLSIPLTDDGAFAVDAMQPHVRDRLSRAVADPNLRLKLALDPAPAAAAALPAAWDDEFAGSLYDLLGAALKWAAKRYGYTPGQAALLEFSADERKALGGPTAAVLDKYLPGGLDKYGPEFVLAATLLTILQAKARAMAAAAARPPATVHEFPATPAPS